MTAEDYAYDRPFGIYGFESKERLAQSILKDFGRYERAAEAISPLSTDLGPDEKTPLGEFRLSSLVPETESNSGRALAVATSDLEQRQGIEGQYFKLDLDALEVVEVQSIFVTHSSLLHTKTARENEALELTNRFDKPELEDIMRLIGKLAASLETIKELPEKAIECSLPSSAGLRKTGSIEPRVQFTLQHYALDTLSEMYPGRESSTGGAMSPAKEPVNILDRKEFIEAIKSLFRRDTDESLSETSITVQHEVDTDHYLVHVEQTHGELSRISLVCQDENGAYLIQELDLKAENDEEDFYLSGRWDYDALLKTSRNGTPISEKMYHSYLQLQRPNTQ